MKDQLTLFAIRINPNDVGIPTSTGTIGDGLTNIIQILFSVIGGLSVIFIIVGGLQIVTAGDNPARYKQGRETVLYAVIGIVVALSALAVVGLIGRSLG